MNYEKKEKKGISSTSDQTFRHKQRRREQLWKSEKRTNLLGAIQKGPERCSKRGGRKKTRHCRRKKELKLQEKTPNTRPRQEGKPGRLYPGNRKLLRFRGSTWGKWLRDPSKKSGRGDKDGGHNQQSQWGDWQENLKPLL